MLSFLGPQETLQKTLMCANMLWLLGSSRVLISVMSLFLLDYFIFLWRSPADILFICQQFLPGSVGMGKCDVDQVFFFHNDKWNKNRVGNLKMMGKPFGKAVISF